MLPEIPIEVSKFYRSQMTRLTKRVDTIMSQQKDINKIIGFNPLSVMYANHRNHAEFMSAVFYVGDYRLLTKTVPWVYRAYSSHSFTYDYFKLELEAWITAMLELNKSSKLGPIMEIYEWMISKHDQMVEISKSEKVETPPIDPDWVNIKNHFQVSLLDGNSRKCFEIASEFLKNNTLLQLYTQIIQVAMYEIGYLWERGEISVAQEHLASSIVTRIMAGTINNMLPATEEYKGKVLLTAAPNEYHEIGIWMVADIMEQAGWNIKFTGADTPKKDLVKLLQSFKPDVLGISVTIPFNIDKAKDIIVEVRNIREFDKMKILVGGKSFNDNPEVWQVIGADGFASTPEEAEKLAAQWLCT